MPRDSTLQDYSIQIEAKINLPGAPSALKAMPLASPNRFLITAIPDENRVVVLKSGMASLISDIETGAGPFDISPGGAEHAYIACKEDRTIDVISSRRRVTRLDLPGVPQGLAWNGVFKQGRRRLMVACELPGHRNGVVCVIDEERMEIINTLQVGRNPRGVGLDRQRRLEARAAHTDRRGERRVEEQLRRVEREHPAGALDGLLRRARPVLAGFKGRGRQGTRRDTQDPAFAGCPTRREF